MLKRKFSGAIRTFQRGAASGVGKIIYRRWARSYGNWWKRTDNQGTRRGRCHGRGTAGVDGNPRIITEHVGAGAITRPPHLSISASCAPLPRRVTPSLRLFSVCMTFTYDFSNPLKTPA